ncbi:hypothetical protein NliqN6_1840 [Naganishia liquefaciens]|uniref:Uncharacterized protein n=1 Tax=Naganishia liquefaciens TaxID=104408 RepID=A0A8H3TQS6_9TREE|nr:hypothetical protein NliqN6_1840 [Naganishia liquefaciens]
MSFLSNLPTFDTSLLARVLPLIPVITASNVLAISTEWICHLAPLTTLKSPISAKTISEVFRRSYINGAYTFLANLLLSIASSGYLWYLAGKGGEGSWYAGATTDIMSTSSSKLLHSSSVHPMQSLPPSDLRRTFYGLTCIFGVLHLAPFGIMIVRYVHKACDGQGKLKDEKEVKAALKNWLWVNSLRIWMDVAGVVCAVAALVVD